MPNHRPTLKCEIDNMDKNAEERYFFTITAAQKDEEMLPILTTFAQYTSKMMVRDGDSGDRGAIMYQSTLEVMEKVIATRGTDGLMLNGYQLAAIQTARVATKLMGILGDEESTEEAERE